jgi:hypothetical protein
MTPRFASVSLASLLLCTACPSDDEGETSTTINEGDSETETDTETGTDTETDTETDTGPTCGVGAMTCCAELEECVTNEDCCDPGTYTCTLEAASTKCVDLVQMCTDCVANCEGQGVPPDVCASSCALWCSPP